MGEGGRVVFDQVSGSSRLQYPSEVHFDPPKEGANRQPKYAGGGSFSHKGKIHDWGLGISWGGGGV